MLVGGWQGDGTLRFELRPEGQGCLLTFTHTFADRGQAPLTAAGWDRCSARLDALLAGQTMDEAASLAAWPDVHERRIADGVMHPSKAVVRLGLQARDADVLGQAQRGGMLGLRLVGPPGRCRAMDWLADVSISGYLSNVTVNGVDVSGFVSAELDRRHPERAQFREVQTASDFRAMWDTIERLWAQAAQRAGRLPAAALTQQVSEEWSFAQTLRHLVFITDAWASRTVLDEEMPYHPAGLPQSWYPAADAAGLGIDLAAEPGYDEILAARADRMAVIRQIVAGLTDDGLGRLCPWSPAPGYPQEERTVADCIAVVMDEEIEHYRFAMRDLSVLESR